MTGLAAYCLVEFKPTKFDNGGLAVVCQTWLTPRKNESFWPPHKNRDAYFRALREKLNPEEDSWKLFPVERLFYETGK